MRRTRPMKGRGLFSAVGVTVALLVTGAPAASQEADTIDLSLEQALEIARGNNPGYRRAVNSLDVGGAETRAVWMGQVLPRVQLSLVNTGYDGNLTRQTRDVFGNPARNPVSEWVYSSSTTQSLNLGWSIQGKSIVNALRGLRVDDRGRELTVETAGFDVAANVRRQYFAVLRQRELLDMEQSGLEGRLRDQEVTVQRFRFAQVDRVQVLNAELAVEDQERAIRQQRRALEQARLVLRTTLADPELSPFRVVEESVPLFDPSELDDSALIEEALIAHPDIRQAEVGVDQSQLAVSTAKSNRWPSLSFSYRLGRQTFNRGSGGALFDFSHDPNDLYNNFNISLSVPYLTNYFGNRQQEVQAEVALRNQRESLRETRLQVEQEVRAQLIALRNQYETLVANRRRLEIAEEALGLAREQYRLGTMSFLELQPQVDAERQARQEAITASYGFYDALLNLEDAVGGPVRGEPPVTDGGNASVGGAR